MLWSWDNMFAEGFFFVKEMKNGWGLVDIMVLGQYRAIPVGTWWDTLSVTWYWLVLSDTGLEKGFYACILDLNDGLLPFHRRTNG